ncbi:MAG: methyl-accepting chemotaxis protein, partial [Bacillota bacterium]
MFNKLKNSIIFKINSLLFISILIGLVIMGAFVVRTIRSELEEIAIERNEEAVSAFKDDLETFFANQEDLLIATSNLDSVQEIDQEEMFADFNYAIDVNSDLLHIYLGTEDGEMHIRPETELPEDFDPRDRPWYQEAREVDQGEAIWTEPYVDAGTGQLIISAAVPAYDEDDEFIGVVAGDISLQLMSNLVKTYEIGETGYPYIATNDGTLLAHPDSDMVEEEFNISEVFDTSGILGTEETGNLEYQYEGVDSIASYAPLEQIEATVFAQINQSEAFASATTLRNIIMIISVLAIIAITLVISYFIRKQVLKPIVNLNGVITRLADFDLRFDKEHEANNYLDRQDEIGDITRSIAEMQQNLYETVERESRISDDLAASSQELSANSQEISASAEQVSTAIEQVASGSQEQSAQVDETKNIVGSLSAQIKSINETAEKMEEQARNVSESIETGNKDVNNSIEQVNQVNSNVKEMAEQITDLERLSQEIENIVELISGISEQTNLLALNAAIEAARAGEAGRGFSVVADEIRELAEETTASTEKIDDLINEIKKNINNTANMMNESEEVVDDSVSAIENTEKSFARIDQAVESLNAYINEISEKNQKMIENNKQVNEAIEEIAKVSQEASTNAEEVAASSEEQAA